MKFPDTASGAIAALEEMIGKKLPGAKATIDPSVEGVWMVRFRGARAIVYLNGYRDPFGIVREQNDFEAEDHFEEVI